MPSLHIRSLFIKVVIPIVALVLTSMAAVSFLAMRAMSESVARSATERAQYELEVVQTTVLDVMSAAQTGHERRLQKAIERFDHNPDVDAVRVLSPSGQVLYASTLAEVGQMMPAHASPPAEWDRQETWSIMVEGPDRMHAARPIMNEPRCAACHAADDDVLAFIDVDISLSRQTAGMRTWGTMASATAAAQFVIIGIGIALILSHVVVRPLRRLSASMHQVQHGNLDVAAEPPGTVEMNDLVEGFNDMVGRLRRARQVEEDAQREHLSRVEQLAALGEMAASLAHEIRNPLSGTKAAVDVLASEEKAEEPRRILRHISEELARLDGVVRQLLSFARPKTPVPVRVDLRTVIDNAVMLSKPGAAAQGVTLEVQGSPEPREVLADADMVQQVVVNLLINAMQASERVSDARVVLSTDIRDGQFACSVRDNGPGVPADRAESIFRPFMTTKARGTGLGLATSRRLIELQGGRLWLENPGEPGACFTFTLPAFAESPQTDA